MNETINSRIRKVRKDFCNDSNVSFADRLNKQPNTTSNWIREGYAVGRGVANEIASEFLINVKWLLTGEGPMLKSDIIPSECGNDRNNSYIKGQTPANCRKETLKYEEMEGLLDLFRGSQKQLDKVLEQQHKLISIIENLTSGNTTYTSDIELEKKSGLGYLVEGKSKLSAKK